VKLREGDCTLPEDIAVRDQLAMQRFTLLTNTVWAAAVVLIVLLLPLLAVAQMGWLDEIQVQSKGLEGKLLSDSPTRNVTAYVPHEYGTKPDK
jgi:hypothetical protein